MPVTPYFRIRGLRPSARSRDIGCGGQEAGRHSGAVRLGPVRLWPSLAAEPTWNTLPSALARCRWSAQGSIRAACSATRPGGCGMAATHSPPSPRAVSFEADQAAQVLPDPDVVVVPIVGVHGAAVPGGKVVVEGCAVVSARRLPSRLRALAVVLGPERVAALATRPGSASALPPDRQRCRVPATCMGSPLGCGGAGGVLCAVGPGRLSNDHRSPVGSRFLPSSR